MCGNKTPFFHSILWNSLCSLLLYKQLPSKIKILSLILNVYFIGLQLYSEGKLYSSIVPYYFPTIALHIETTSLADGTYELIQEPDGDISKAQANVVEITEDPNFNSEEPKSADFIDTTTGKPRCIILLFQIIQLIVTTYLCT